MYRQLILCVLICMPLYGASIESRLLVESKSCTVADNPITELEKLKLPAAGKGFNECALGAVEKLSTAPKEIHSFPRILTVASKVIPLVTKKLTKKKHAELLPLLCWLHGYTTGGTYAGFALDEKQGFTRNYFTQRYTKAFSARLHLLIHPLYGQVSIGLVSLLEKKKTHRSSYCSPYRSD